MQWKETPLRNYVPSVDSSKIQSKGKQYCTFHLILNDCEDIIKTNIREPQYVQWGDDIATYFHIR